MLYGEIFRQRLKVVNAHVVADTINYLEMKFTFLSDDWDGLDKWAHFANGETVYDVRLTDDCIRKEDRLNLSAGFWRVYLHGNEFREGEVIERITTNVEMLRVEPTGILSGEPFPTVPPSAGEQIIAAAAAAEAGAKSAADEAGRAAGSAKDSADLAAERAEVTEKLAKDAEQTVKDTLKEAKESGEFDGAPGEDGVSITSVKQTTTSSADGGVNVVTVTLSDGQSATFTVKNGSTGSAGKDGVNGADGAPGPKGEPGDDYILTKSDKQEIAGMTPNGNVMVVVVGDSLDDLRITAVIPPAGVSGEEAYALIAKGLFDVVLSIVDIDDHTIGEGMLRGLGVGVIEGGVGAIGEIWTNYGAIYQVQVELNFSPGTAEAHLMRSSGGGGVVTITDNGDGTYSSSHTPAEIAAMAQTGAVVAFAPVGDDHLLLPLIGISESTVMFMYTAYSTDGGVNTIAFIVTPAGTAMEQVSTAEPMSGASATANGTGGTVPAPEKGQQDAVLHGDGTWRKVDGGGSSVKIDSTLTQSGAAADAKATGEKISELSDAIGDVNSDFRLAFETGKNLIDSRKMSVGLIASKNGNIDDTQVNYKTTEYIPVSTGQSITLSGYVRRFIAYDYNKSAMQASYVSDQQTVMTYTATADGYIRASFHLNHIGVTAQAEYGTEVTSYEPFCFYMTSFAKFGETQTDETLNILSYPVNLIDPAAFTDGIIDRNTGVISENASYKTTDFIPVENGQSITFSPRIRKFLAYRTDKASIGNTYVNADTENYTYTATVNGYVRASFHTDYIKNAQAEYGATATPYIEYGHRRLIPEIEVQAAETEEVPVVDDLANENILSGKKWCACGDSFTQGDFTGLQESEYLLQDGKYAGKNAVYPYIIGNRNDMDVVNIAVGGMTMCCIDGTRQNSFTYNDYYKNRIPLDSDYITLKFGINDNNYSSPLGNIDDADNTTFYGAWNIVLDWLTQKFPIGKIGIIITNGITDDAGKAYLDATIAVARKWGIAYLDEVNDDKIPLLLRVKRDNLSDVAYIRKLETFRVSETNLHPNAACHEYESTFVENFLRSL